MLKKHKGFFLSYSSFFQINASLSNSIQLLLIVNFFFKKKKVVLFSLETHKKNIKDSKQRKEIEEIEEEEKNKNKETKNK